MSAYFLTWAMHSNAPNFSFLLRRQKTHLEFISYILLFSSTFSYENVSAEAGSLHEHTQVLAAAGVSSGWA